MDRHRIRAIPRRGLFQPLSLALGGLLLITAFQQAWAQPQSDSENADTRQTSIGKRNPWVAYGLSFLPGLGQFYNHEYTNGAVIMGLFLPSAAYYFWAVGDFNHPGEKKPSGGERVLFAGSALVATGVGVWAMIDAPLSAKRINRLNGYSLSKSSSLQLGVSPSPRDPKKCQVGLVLKKGGFNLMG